MKMISFAVLALAACTQPELSGGENANETELAQSGDQAAPADRRPPRVGNPDAPAPDVPIKSEPATEEPRQTRPAGGESAGEACRASHYRYLVGRPRSQIPSRPAGETWRVTCTSCPMTMDYSEARLNILYDEESQIVQEVRCG